eukprot:TRINITY_DN28329_c0_g1_i1.p1 TRINITY_DN28329_c0_g1~~TRINITY_DN28329_c0_g1_i1.p1  ORF type:complete len:475 (-),score=112.84 TRINITY_DN28329_c0_g1_i1:180-1604(-)
MTAPADMEAYTAAYLAGHHENFELRVREKANIAANPWNGPVALSDLLGGQLVTFDDCIDVAGDPQRAVAPKAVFVQYNSADPVTGQDVAVVIPAEMCLDVFVHPGTFTWQPPEEESVEEEVPKTADKEAAIAKLRSSDKGDPILMRAPPAPAPEPHFAPLRYEMLNAIGEGHSCYAATCSSFLKAGGRDRYAVSRMRELDWILENRGRLSPETPRPEQQRQSPEAQMQMNDSRPSTARSRTKAQRDATASTQMPASPKVTDLPMQLQRMPQYRCGSAPARQQQKRDGLDAGTSVMTNATTCSQFSSATAASARGGRGGSSQGKSQGRRLRSLDPHLAALGQRMMPTRRMHSGWPDGLRRPVGRHVYGLTARQIWEEEEKEHSRHARAQREAKAAAQAAQEGPEDDGEQPQQDSLSQRSTEVASIAEDPAKAKQKIFELERILARCGEDAKQVHTLEIRVTQGSRAKRVVLGRSK